MGVAETLPELSECTVLLFRGAMICIYLINLYLNWSFLTA